MSETSDVTTPLVKAINRIPFCRAHRVLSGTAPTRGGYIHGADAGFPDICAVAAGTALYLETKTPEGKLSVEQKKLHGQLRRAGAAVATVRSVREGLSVVRGILDSVV